MMDGLNEDVLHREEPLDPELAQHAYDYEDLGLCIKHPLVFSIMHTPELNALINEQFRHKTEAAIEARREKRWTRFIGLHERPYRLTALTEVAHEMNNADYWGAVAEVWIDSENIFELESLWLEVLTENRPERQVMMHPDDRAELESWDDPVTIFRGFHRAGRELGLSWTIDREKAEWFARRKLRPSDGTPPQIATATVAPSSIIAFLTSRGESEVIALPTDVIIQRIEEVGNSANVRS